MKNLRFAAMVLAASMASAAVLTLDEPPSAPPPPPPAPAAPAEGPAAGTDVAAEPAPASTEGALMRGLGQAGLAQPLKESGITVGGWLEASVTWSFQDPDSNTITGRTFDFEHADPTLNQVGIFFDRQTDASKAWDVGGRAELIFGADARFTASNGMDFQTGNSPENQFDLTQLYAEVVIPVGNGLKTKVGKWITPLGYEYVNPTLNPLYSHSFLFGIVPYSHTGIMATYAFDDARSLGIGISRGWDQSLEDNNDSVDLVWNWQHQCSDKFVYAFNGTIGPEADNNSDYRVALDFWGDYMCSDQLSFGVNLDLVWEEDASQTGDESVVYGAAGYAKYTLNDNVLLVGRLEFFSDQNRASGFDANIVSATLGTTITPFPTNEFASGLKVRPEIRWDLASEDIFDDGDDNQFTAAVEGYFSF